MDQSHRTKLDAQPHRFFPLPPEYYALVEQNDGAMLFETALSEPGACSYLLWKPRAVLVANQGEEIGRVLQEVESAQSNGMWVAGFLSYESAAAFEHVPVHPCTTPLAWFGVYGSARVFDHATGKFSCPPPAPSHLAQDFEISRLHFDIPRHEYASTIQEIREYIAAGDLYQLNFTGRMQFAFRGSSAALFRALRDEQPVGYAAFVNTGEQHILSLSPELFFHTSQGRIRVRPMKGTAARGETEDDSGAAAWLRNDAKNRAENLMIVDLLRNDLGRLCEFGSIRVDELFSIETYDRVHQMTSTISGTLRPQTTFGEIIAGIFPSGSITGAPKIRAMQLIHQLERRARGIYCGAIGFVAPGGSATFNVAIRTITLQHGGGQMGVGGGIVYDSDPDGEWDECAAKSRFLAAAAEPMQLLESLRWDGQCPLLPLHLERLRESAKHFGFGFDRDAIRAALAAHVDCLHQGAHKLRLLLRRDGRVSVESSRLEERAEPLRVALVGEVVHSTDPWLRYKTTRRGLYRRAMQEARRRGVDEVLFTNERGEVTEAANYNVFARIGSRLITPPVTCGLLAGVYRRQVLATDRQACEGVLTIEDLRQASAICLCNAVRGMQPAEICWEQTPCCSSPCTPKLTTSRNGRP